MPTNLRPHSIHGPLDIDEAEYAQLVRRSGGGWSRCEDDREWLAKLHYLRAGFAEGKLERTQFEEREARLVLARLKQLC